MGALDAVTAAAASLVRVDDVQALLAPGERLRLVARPHAAALAARLARRLAWLAALVVAARLLTSDAVHGVLTSPLVLEATGGEPLPVARWVAAAARLGALALVLAMGLDAVRWRLARFAVTDQRILQLSGILVRTAVDTALDSVADLVLVRSWLGERLGYGDVVVLRASERRGLFLRRIEDPLQFRQTLHAARSARLRGLLEQALQRPLGAAVERSTGSHGGGAAAPEGGR